MKLNRISADMVSRRPDQTAEWLNRLARQVDIVEETAGSSGGKFDNLPIATTHSLGVVKVGQNLSITPEGVLSATAPTSFDYNNLSNKPKINSVELIGNTSLSDLGIDIPTKTSELLNDGSDGTSTYVEADDLATVATSGSYGDLLNKPTIGDATLTIQKNGTNVDTFTANATSNKTINITVPTTAADVGALPDTTKYAASLSLTINSSTYVVTGQLKDQDGNNLGTAQTIDLPLESVVVSGSYDSATKEVVLTLQNGSTIRFSVADLVSGLQTEITSANPLDADLVDDSTSTHKFVTAANKTTWDNKQDKLIAGTNIQIAADGKTISATDTTYSAGTNIQITGTTISATDTTYSAGTGIDLTGTTFSVDSSVVALQSDLPTKTSDLSNDGSDGTSTYVEADDLATVATSGDYDDLINKPSIPTVNDATLTIQKNGTTVNTFTANASSNVTANITVPTKTSDIANDGADGTSTYVENDDLTTALAGKQNVLTAGTNIDITSSTISTQTRGIEYIVGTQASSTNVWTGTSTDAGCSSGTLYTGKTIVYHLPYAGTSSAATLNLTLPDGSTTGAKGVKYNTGSNVGTTYGAGCDIFMVYDGTNWKTSAWYDSNNYDRLRYQNAVKAAAAISSSRLCVGTNAGYIMAAANATFDITYPLLFSGGAVESGATSNNFYGAISSLNLTNNKSGWSGTQYKMVFLVGTLSGTTFTIDSAVFTQTVPSTEDGKTYAPIGITYNTTNILFYPNNTYWAYKNGEFRPISHSPATMTGATAGTAGASGLVPAPAAGDDTKFLSGDGTWKTAGSSSASQSMIIAQGSTQPVFDDMTPIKTFTWTVADTTYRPIYQMENTGWDYDNMDITVAYRITVTGTGINQITDVVDRWISPTQWPITSIMARTLSASNATTGYRNIRAVYPTTSGLNNNTYKIGQEIYCYNATSRTIKVEVFRTDPNVTWNETKPAGTIYTSSTYQGNNNLTVGANRGWLLRQPVSFTATAANAANRITQYESSTVGSSVIKAGATALVANHLAFQATDGLIYDISNTAKNMVCDENAKIGLISSAVSANGAIDTSYMRQLYNLTSTMIGYISHGTLALGDRVYLRCTMDSSGNIHSDNYLATSMSAGYTWVPFGTATASNTVYMDVRKPVFYTLNSSGKLTHINGKKTTPDITVTSVDPGEGTSLGADEYVAVTGVPDYSDMIDIFYPVGSYYETSDTSFDPNVTWAGTTWQEDTAGRVLVAVDSGTFNTVGGTGGSETSTHRHWQTGGADSDHYYELSTSGISSESLDTRVVTKSRVSISAGSAATGGMRQSSTYDANSSTVQPYTVVKRWHRVA